jgi:hypothetical protein
MPLFGCRCVYELLILLAHQQNNHGKSMLQGNTSTAISTAPFGTVITYLIELYVLFSHLRNQGVGGSIYAVNGKKPPQP